MPSKHTRHARGELAAMESEPSQMHQASVKQGYDLRACRHHQGNLESNLALSDVLSPPTNIIGGETLRPPDTAVQRISHENVANTVEEHDPARGNSIISPSSIAGVGDELVAEGQDQEERTLVLSVPRGGPQARMVQVPHGIKLGPRRETPPPASPRVGTGSDALSLAQFQPHGQGESTPKTNPREDTPDPCAAGMLPKALPREAEATPESISVPRVLPTSPAPVSASTAVVPIPAVEGGVSAIAAPASWLSGHCYSPSSPYRKETNTPGAQSLARARRSGLGDDDSGEIMRIHGVGAGEVDKENRRHTNGQPRTPTTDILRRLLYENTPASHATDSAVNNETGAGEQGNNGMNSSRRRSRQGRRLFAEGSTVLRAFPTASESVAEVRRGPSSLFSDSVCR
ncbi:unnamed protein product [Ectocarpus sp. 4 AP-2014]